MGEFRMVPVKDLEPPDEPDRQDSIMVNMDELCRDLAANGLMNPICVEDLEDGRFKVFAGHRRSIAVTIMNWPEVMCHVFPKGDPAIERMKASENLKRNQLNEREEALVYRRVHEREKMEPTKIAIYFDVPEVRVRELIDLSHGDEEVFRLLGTGEISRAQAMEINRFETPIGRKLAIEEAVRHGLKAPGIRRWRLEMQRGAGEHNIQAAIDSLPHLQPIEVSEPMQICMFGDHPAPLRHSKSYIICSDHWNAVIEGLELRNAKYTGGNNGGGSA